MRWILLLLAATAAADEWLAYGEREWRGGERRLVVSEAGFRLLDGGKVVAEGKLPQLPLDAHVLEGGAVLFEKYGQVGFGFTLALLGADGRLRWRLTLEQAIPGGAGDAPRSVSSIWWSRAWWVDEPRGKVVLVARNGTLSEVDLATGKAAPAAKEVVLRAFALPRARDAALEVAVELSPEGLREAAEPLLEDAALPPPTRLRAAVAAGAVTREIWEAALGDGVAEADRQAVVAFAGKHADVDLLEAAALRKDVGREAVTALAERGAVRALAGLVTHASLDRDVRALAAQLLGRQAADEVLAAVDREMEDADAEQGGALLRAAIATGAPGLEARLQRHEAVLLKVLDQETGDLPWLADYFRGRPTSEAVKPLVRALAAHKGDRAVRTKLIGALKSCSGEDFGDDADAWISALGRR